MRTLAILLLLSFAAAVFCQEIKTVDPDWNVPEKAQQRPNPLASKPELAAGGSKIFNRNCLQCHGDATHDRKNNAPDLASPAVQQETDGALFWRISTGNARKGMPSFSSLPEAQRWQIVLYIRSMSSKH
jgi:mono/diheme cytochrome c family protein